MREKIFVVFSVFVGYEFPVDDVVDLVVIMDDFLDDRVLRLPFFHSGL